MSNHKGINRKVVKFVNRYFQEKTRGWSFQPILLTCLFFGVIFVTVSPGDPPIDFTRILGGKFGFVAWVWLMLSAPILYVLSYHMINWKDGKVRYKGYWVRFASSTNLFVGMLSFLLAWILSGRHTGNDYRIVFFSIAIAVIIFSLLLVIRDAWQLVWIEIVAGKIRVQENERDGDG